MKKIIKRIKESFFMQTLRHNRGMQTEEEAKVADVEEEEGVLVTIKVMVIKETMVDIEMQARSHVIGVISWDTMPQISRIGCLNFKRCKKPRTMTQKRRMH